MPKPPCSGFFCKMADHCRKQKRKTWNTFAAQVAHRTQVETNPIGKLAKRPAADITGYDAVLLLDFEKP